MACPICGARCRCRNSSGGICCPCHRHKPTARLMHAAQLELRSDVMPNPEMFLLCAHHSSYCCIACGKCSNCCKCPSVAPAPDTPAKMPKLISTLSLEAQDRLRELRRVRDEEYARNVKPQ